MRSRPTSFSLSSVSANGHKATDREELQLQTRRLERATHLRNRRTPSARDRLREAFAWLSQEEQTALAATYRDRKGQSAAAVAVGKRYVRWNRRCADGAPPLETPSPPAEAACAPSENKGAQRIICRIPRSISNWEPVGAPRLCRFEVQLSGARQLRAQPGASGEGRGFGPGRSPELLRFGHYRRRQV